MDWIKKFDLFLFDFDGLLVNTEELHYTAYQRMMQKRGVALAWNFERYCQAAHYDSTQLRDQITEEYPELIAQVTSWDILYKEKQDTLLDLIEEGNTQLMPGVDKLLQALEKAQIPRAVVTHSPEALVRVVRRQNPLLNSIPHWTTREHYSRAKPDPECYLHAIHRLAKPGNSLIGFEDTPRGLKALAQTTALPVLVCSTPYPEISTLILQGAKHFTTFENMEI